eukprot:5118918-Pyramimonas_sp.AAC.1
MRHPCGVERIFGDLRNLWAPSIREALQGLEDQRAAEILERRGPRAPLPGPPASISLTVRPPA